MTGLCVVRVESQPDGHRLITVMATADTESPDREARQVQWFSAVDGAVAAVETFLRGFEPAAGTAVAPQPRVIEEPPQTPPDRGPMSAR